MLSGIYGWAKANTSDIVVPEFQLPEFKLGVIPNTTLPSVINLNDAVSHHIALLGVTGAGKSFLAREIIKELIVKYKCNNNAFYYRYNLFLGIYI